MKNQVQLSEFDIAKLIEDLKQISFSISLGAGGGVTDTAWMLRNDGTDSSETICERIDGILLGLGVDHDELDRDVEQWGITGKRGEK